MITVYFDLLRDEPVAALIFIGAVLTALLTGITFHEFSHAYTADTMGDGLPRRFGRVTLNPLAHLEPMGTILMLFVGFGWGRPVPVNPYATKNPKAALWITAGAGPLSNFLLAGLVGIPLKLDWVPWVSPFNLSNFDRLAIVGWTTDEYIGLYLSSIALFGIILGVFNLLPVAPLDGFKVAVGLLPQDLSRAYAELEPWGPVILLVLLISPFLTGGEFSILFEIMEPFIRFFARVLAGVDGDVFVG